MKRRSLRSIDGSVSPRISWTSVPALTARPRSLPDTASGMNSPVTAWTQTFAWRAAPSIVEMCHSLLGNDHRRHIAVGTMDDLKEYVNFLRDFVNFARSQ